MIQVRRDRRYGQLTVRGRAVRIPPGRVDGAGARDQFGGPFALFEGTVFRCRRGHHGR